MPEELGIVVECEDGTDSRCNGFHIMNVEIDQLTEDQISRLKDEEEQNDFVSRETLEEIREAIGDEDWGQETTCDPCGSDSDGLRGDED